MPWRTQIQRPSIARPCIQAYCGHDVRRFCLCAIGWCSTLLVGMVLAQLDLRELGIVRKSHPSSCVRRRLCVRWWSASSSSDRRVVSFVNTARRVPLLCYASAHHAEECTYAETPLLKKWSRKVLRQRFVCGFEYILCLRGWWLCVCMGICVRVWLSMCQPRKIICIMNIYWQKRPR